jgi:hypothetical protein
MVVTSKISYQYEDNTAKQMTVVPSGIAARKPKYSGIMVDVLELMVICVEKHHMLHYRRENRVTLHL